MLGVRVADRAPSDDLRRLPRSNPGEFLVGAYRDNWCIRHPPGRGTLRSRGERKGKCERQDVQDREIHLYDGASHPVGFRGGGTLLY